MTEETLMKDFLIFLSYFGTHLDNPFLAEVLEELELTERETVTEPEMQAVMDGLALKIRAGLDGLATPQAASFAQLLDRSAAAVGLAQ